jgi:hypothetical protein
MPCTLVTDHPVVGVTGGAPVPDRRVAGVTSVTLIPDHVLARVTPSAPWRQTGLTRRPGDDNGRHRDTVWHMGSRGSLPRP